MIPVALAVTYLAVGDLDGTFTWLDRMYEERSPVLIWMNVQPRYDSLRGDPRFQELLKKDRIHGSTDQPGGRFRLIRQPDPH